MITVLEIIGYAFCCMVAGSILMYGFSDEIAATAYDPWPMRIFLFIAGIAWPCTLVFGIGAGFAWLLYHAMHRLAFSLGSIHNRGKVNASRIRLMEEDLERVGGSLELALRYDYEMCRSCFGKGCQHCNKTGVQRVKVQH